MRAVVQRVSRARVLVGAEVVGSIEAGLCVLVGVTDADTAEDSIALAEKLAGLRIFSDEAQKMNLSVKEIEGAVLVVSQFTLYGDVRKGRRPSFVGAAAPSHAEPLVAVVAEHLASRHGLAVATGRFGAMMQVELVNDGPVTLVMETAAGKVL